MPFQMVSDDQPKRPRAVWFPDSVESDNPALWALILRDEDELAKLGPMLH